MSLDVRVANAPVSYGVFEITVGGEGLPDPDDLLAEMASAGYAGTELGPPGYLGRGDDLAARLARHGLALVGSFLPMRLSDDAAFAEDTPALDEALAILAVGAADGPPPVVLLCDAFCELGRIRHAGAIEEHPETWLDAAGQARLIANAHRAAERCRDAGFPVSFHYHAGTYVETPRELDWLCAGLDASLLGICLDTGHTAFGGGDGLDVLARYGALVNHVHLKDVDLALLRQVHASGLGLAEAWRAGVFCGLGTGDARVDDCLAALERHGYHGWVVVEQDAVLTPERSFADVVGANRTNREWLRARGI